MSYQSKEPCVCCGLRNPSMVCYHHLLTRGSHPEYASEKRNMIPVCLLHHNHFHSYGTTYMAKKYLEVKLWLTRNEWDYSEGADKWRPRWKDKKPSEEPTLDVR